MQVSKWGKLGKTQAELDFVDVDPKRDTRLFVDPYAIEIKGDAWSRECGRYIRSFFDALIKALRDGNEARAEHLASHLHEPEETFLGMSRGHPQGRGLGREQAGRVLNALRRSKAFQSGLLSELGEAELFIEGIGPDKISDLTTNVIRGPLIAYTKEQADLWGMPLTKSGDVGSVWNPEKEDWESGYREVLRVGNVPVILVPKYSVRIRMSLDSQEFYNHHMVEYLRAEYLRADKGLVVTLKSGEKKVYKSEVKNHHPFSKPNLAEFVHQHPQVLEQYKKIKGASGALDSEEIEKGFDEKSYARSLIIELGKIIPGNDDASGYHKFCLGALTFLFYPNLIRPVKEREIDSGRKRIDIVFANSSQSGFFDVALKSPQMRAIEVVVECKNYSRDVNNPELDQIEGRFSNTRGFLGILCSRSFSDKARFIERCNDAAKSRSHYVIPLDDADIIAMLELVEGGERAKVDGLLRRRLSEVTA